MPKFSVNNHEINAKLILFDIDGTLVDDKNRYKHLAKARYEAFTRLLGEKEAETWTRLEGITMNPLKVDMNGPLSKAPRREDLAIASTAIYLNGKTWNDAKTMATKIYSQADETMKEIYKPALFDNNDDTLNELKSTGFMLGVATNGDSKISKELLECIGVDSLFDVVIGADMVNDAKPSPEMIIKACESLEIAPSETVYVGDQPTDIQAGRAAEVGFIIAVGDETLLDEGAHFVVDSVSEFGEIGKKEFS